MDQQSSLLSRLTNWLQPRDEYANLVPGKRLRLSGVGLRIPYTGEPLEIELGKQLLRIYPDYKMDPEQRDDLPDLLVFDPTRYLNGIGHYMRICPGKRLSISRHTPFQSALFSHPREAFRRHLQINYDGEELVFRDSISELGTYLYLIDGEPAPNLVLTSREKALKRLIDIYGGPIQELPKEEAMETLIRVNQLLKDEPYRRQDIEGNPGGLIEFPEHLTPILIGDLHAVVDNLVQIFSVNGFQEELENGRAVLLFLGDMIHREQDELMESMDSSLLIMDLFMKLKLCYPEQVFLLVGNHDSFSHDVMKFGVPQSLLWERYVVKQRGVPFRDALESFYNQCAYVAISDDFVACHAGPPSGTTSREQLINIRHLPELAHELTWTRVKGPRYLVGYTRGEVRRFRKSLELRDDLPFIVGHYPLGQYETIWLDISKIENHHILYSAHLDNIGVFTRIQGEMIPQIYPAEPLLVDWLNRQEQ